MTYREIEQTISITESERTERVPVEVSGEITVSTDDIASDSDAEAGDVHELTNSLESAIEEVLESYE